MVGSWAYLARRPLTPFIFATTRAGLTGNYALRYSSPSPLREDRYIGNLVVAVFDNMLPDNVEIRRRLAASSNAGGIDAYSLLIALGRDCVGAMQFLPEGNVRGVVGTVTGGRLTEQAIAKWLSNLDTPAAQSRRP